ncbi:MAG: type II toxin-antitoxin system YafQ family toxin [bacterium]|nr:type II toxin-antitoxin system YafQ family toxin [bacterium]
MYRITTTRGFRKALKRYRQSGKFREEKLERVVDMLAFGERLPAACRDHGLQGAMADFRECHILPDLLLVYRVLEKELILVLVDLGTHDELFGR